MVEARDGSRASAYLISREIRVDLEVEVVLDVPGLVADLALVSSYGQIGIPITDQFSVWLQGDFQRVLSSSGSFTRSYDFLFREDLGISLKYDFTAKRVLKAEYHEVDQELDRLVPVDGPAGFQLDPEIVSLGNGSYWIVSFSVAF